MAETRYCDERGVYAGGAPTDPRWVPVPEHALDGLAEVVAYLKEKGMTTFAERVRTVTREATLSAGMATVLLEHDGETTKVWWGSRNGSLYGSRGEMRALLIDKASHLTRPEREAGMDGK